MSGLEDLLSQIPTSDIASKIGVDEAEVNKAVQLLVPVLVGGLPKTHRIPSTPARSSPRPTATPACSTAA